MNHAELQPTAVSARTGPRWLNIGTALALATVFGLLTFLLTSTGDSVTETADATTDVVVASVAQPANPAPASSSSSSSSEPAASPVETTATESGGSADTAAASSVPVVAGSSAITNMGPTEVGYVTNFPAVDYAWQRVEIPGAGVFEAGWLGEFNGRLVSVSVGWEQGGGEGQSLITQTSDDALQWEELSTYELPGETWVSQIVGNKDLVIAVAERWESESGDTEQLLLTTSDGLTWSSSVLALDAAPDENVYIHSVVMGPAGIAISAQVDTYPEEQPSTLVFDPYEVRLDHVRNTFTLTDTRSGEVVLSGSLDDIFNRSSDGQNIYDPDTGELLTTIPYDVWERAYAGVFDSNYGGGSPLPIPIQYGEPTQSGVVEIEYDGLVIVIDEYSGTYTVGDAASGDEIAGGPLNLLYEGLPPTFTDPETGEVLLTVTWEEWYQAEEQAYAEIGYGEDLPYAGRAILATSADGETWSVETVSDRTGGSATYLAATADGFVARVTSYGDQGEWSTVWTMAGGVWSAVDVDRSDLWLHQVAVTDNGLVGIGDGSGGPALWSSPDGVDWVSEFAIVPQDDGSYAWLADVTAGDAGVVGALAMRERYGEYSPLVIVQEEYTVTFENGDFVLEVTETATGEAVLTLRWPQFDDGSAAELVTYEDGATSIALSNGDVMVISDDESYAALDLQYADTGQIGFSVFLNDGTGWVETVVEAEGGISGASQLVVVDGKIIVSGSYWGMESSYREAYPSDATSVILVGTRVGE